MHSSIPIPLAVLVRSRSMLRKSVAEKCLYTRKVIWILRNDIERQAYEKKRKSMMRSRHTNVSNRGWELVVFQGRYTREIRRLRACHKFSLVDIYTKPPEMYNDDVFLSASFKGIHDQTAAGSSVTRKPRPKRGIPVVSFLSWIVKRLTITRAFNYLVNFQDNP